MRPGRALNGVDAVNTQTKRQYTPMTLFYPTPAALAHITMPSDARRGEQSDSWESLRGGFDGVYDCSPRSLRDFVVVGDRAIGTVLSGAKGGDRWPRRTR
jgi:hypothetical protein